MKKDSTFKNFMFASFLTLSLLSIFGFSQQPKNQLSNNTIKAYMTVVVKIENTQKEITISENERIIRQILVLNRTPRILLRNWERENIEVLFEEEMTEYDNRKVLKILNEYFDQGWSLHSQSVGIGIGKSEDTSEELRIIQYILEK